MGVGEVTKQRARTRTRARRSDVMRMFRCLVALRCLCVLRQAVAPCSRMECTITQSTPCLKPNNLPPQHIAKQSRLHRALATADTKCSGWATRVWHAVIREEKWSKLNSTDMLSTAWLRKQRNEAPNALFALRVVGCAVCLSPSSSVRARLFCCLCSHPLLALNSPSPILASPSHALLHTKRQASNHIHAGS